MGIWESATSFVDKAGVLAGQVQEFRAELHGGTVPADTGVHQPGFVPLPAVANFPAGFSLNSRVVQIGIAAVGAVAILLVMKR